MMKPTRYEFEAPTRIHGAPLDCNTKIDITQQPGNGGWVATMHVVTSPATSSADAQNKLREELLRIANVLGK